MCRPAWLVLLMALLPGAAYAQDAAIVLPGAEPASSSWTWFGDVLLREDRVRDIPRSVRPDIQRIFGRGRFGFTYDPIPQLQFGGAIKLAAASHDNEYDRSYNLNERSNDIAIDQLFVRWHPNESTTLLAGKAEFPLELSPMLWDGDLRPVGVSVQSSLAQGEFNRFGVVAGYFNGNLPYGDDSRIAAVQAAWRWHEGARSSASVIVSYLDFSNLEQLTLQGLARSNAHIGNQLLDDYRLLDAQFVALWHPGGRPLEARLDILRNLGAAAEQDGARFSLVLGDRRQPQAWELGFSAQRIQREAAMAAFNSDEWWFHSRARGVMPWAGYGIDATWSLRLAMFHERADTATHYTDTWLLDANARW